MSLLSPLLNRPSPRSNSSTPTAATPTPSNPPPSDSFSAHPVPSPPSSSSSLSVKSSVAPAHHQITSVPSKPLPSRLYRRMSSPGTQLTPSTVHPPSPHYVLDDIVIGGECGVVNGGTALTQPFVNENWIAHHLTIVLQHSFTVSSSHPITSQSQPSPLSPHLHHPDHPPKPQFLAFHDSPHASDHLRNKFSITSLSSFTTSTTIDDDEDDETDEVEEAESQDSTASSCYFLNLTHSFIPHPHSSCHSFRSDPPPSSSHIHLPSQHDSSAAHSQDPSLTSLKLLPSPIAQSKFPNPRLGLIQILNTWSFDANSLSPLQIRLSLHTLLSIYLEYTPGFIQQLEDLGVVDPQDCLRGLVDNLEAAYDSRNAYHNFRHAVDVTQAVYTILSQLGIVPPLGWVFDKESGGDCESLWHRTPIGRVGNLLDEMSVWALLLAAAGHDVGHPGLSNAFMVNARTPIAYVFSDGAVLENFHRITFTRMLREHGFEKMVDGHAEFRQVLAGAVLSTDMGRHFPIVEQLKRLASDWSKPSRDHNSSAAEDLADKILITAGLIKCGDISNSSRPHHISLTWSSCLLTEWSRQAALEADLHLPVSVVTLDPTEKRAQAKSQIGFTSLFVLPLFTVMEQLSPIAFRSFADNCRFGLTTWQKVVDQIDAQQLGFEPRLIINHIPDSIQPPSPLSIDSTASESSVEHPSQGLTTQSPCSFSPLSGRFDDSLSSTRFLQSQSCHSRNAETRLTPQPSSVGTGSGPLPCPASDDCNAEDSTISSISSSSVSTLRDSSNLPNLNGCTPECHLQSDSSSTGLSASELNPPKILSPPTTNQPCSHCSFSFNVALSHPDRRSNASFSSDEGKANSSNDDSSFSSLGSPSSPPRSPYYNLEVYSDPSTGSSSDEARSCVRYKQVQFDPTVHSHFPVHHLRPVHRSRDKGMSVDTGVIQRNSTRISLPLRKKSYSPHLVNQQVACAKGCGKVTVKCVKCATESKIKMYRSLSLAKPSLCGHETASNLRSPSSRNVSDEVFRNDQQPPSPFDCHSSRTAPTDRADLSLPKRIAEESSVVSANSADFPQQELIWPPHPFRPLH